MNKNITALFLFIVGSLLLNYWAFGMLSEFELLVRVAGQFSINFPLLMIFITNKFYILKKDASSIKEVQEKKK